MLEHWFSKVVAEESLPLTVRVENAGAKGLMTTSVSGVGVSGLGVLMFAHRTAVLRLMMERRVVSRYIMIEGELPSCRVFCRTATREDCNGFERRRRVYGAKTMGERSRECKSERAYKNRFPVKAVRKRYIANGARRSRISVCDCNREPELIVKSLYQLSNEVDISSVDNDPQSASNQDILTDSKTASPNSEVMSTGDATAFVNSGKVPSNVKTGSTHDGGPSTDDATEN